MKKTKKLEDAIREAAREKGAVWALRMASELAAIASELMGQERAALGED